MNCKSTRTVQTINENNFFSSNFRPDPNVRWLKDENPVTLGTNCRSQLRDGLVTLDLAQLKPDDSGVYKLICRNQSGEISCSCRLMVYEVIKEELIAPLFTMPIKGKSFLFKFPFSSFTM